MDEDLLRNIRNDFPWLKFRKGRKFAFSPPNRITIGPDEPGMNLLLLHEVGHALLGHNDFQTDVERLKIEMAAWEKARELADNYGIKYDDDLAQDELDSYRNWLHQKSRCPRCGLTRFSISNGLYRCPKCDILD